MVAVDSVRLDLRRRSGSRDGEPSRLRFPLVIGLGLQSKLDKAPSTPADLALAGLDLVLLHNDLLRRDHWILDLSRVLNTGS